LIAAMRIDALIAPEHAQSPAVQAARQAGVAILGLRTFPALAAGTFELAAPPARAPVAVEPPGLDDIVLLTPTSGTTSAPKIVPHTNRRIAEAVRDRAKLGQLTSHDRSLLATPVGNPATIRRVLLPPLALGGSVVCVAHFDANRFIDWLREYAPTHYMASVATQIAILEELQRRPHPVRHALRFTMSAGASLPPSVQSRLERALGMPVIQGYGMTETGSIAQVPFPPDRAPAGSTGRPTLEVAITDESGRALGPDELGEVTVRGPEVFDGYENDPDATAAAFRDGWFRTGDLGRIDRDGFLFLAGRIKDVINRGGSKVAPVEVENLLASHPQVAQAAAFAMPHPTLGEDLAAAVVLRDNAALSEDELRNFARAHLASFKVPTRIITVTELPRGSFDKVKRAELAAIAQQRLRVEFVAPRDPLEIAIAAIFAEELGVERVGVQDNFFQLGGDSLSCVRVMRSMAQAFAVDVDIDAFFATPTAAGLAAEIRNRKPS
jgi:acyl-coenzyme A synthetase/AMP-(fatty) acid ligase/acyl carrier protein